tara:strand:- start:9124 stop:10092 length:969 start_codon:yes stop_codon:yes gene_type:complete
MKLLLFPLITSAFTNIHNKIKHTHTLKSNLQDIPEMTETLLKMSRPDTLPRTTLVAFSGVCAANNDWSSVLNKEFIVSASLATAICANSMIINDAFDAKYGTDTDTNKNMITAGKISEKNTITFLSLSYSTIIASTILFVDSTEIKNMILSSIIITILYTPFLKPKPWIKNISVASVIACTPAVGAIATSGSLQSAINNPDSRLIWLIPTIFTGIMYQEIIMDIADIDNDKNSNITTLPIKYGKDKALFISTLFVYIMGMLACNTNDTTALTVALIPTIAMFFDIAAIKKNLYTDKETKTIKDALFRGKITSSILTLSFCLH